VQQKKKNTQGRILNNVAAIVFTKTKQKERKHIIILIKTHHFTYIVFIKEDPD